jgi:hypothetical protein
MGFFSNLFSNNEGESKNSKWFKNWYFKSEEDKWEEAESFLKLVGEPFQEQKILNIKNDDRIDLFGKSDGYPFRVKFDAYSFGSAEIEMKHVSPLGFIDLEYNPDVQKDKEVEVDEEWNDEDSNNCRLFFAKSVFIEDSESDLKQIANQLSGLPSDFIKSVATLMINRRILYFRIRPDIIEITYHDELIETPDPVNSLISTIQMMSLSAKTIGSVKPVKKGHVDNLVTCKYCKSWQYFNSDGCVNCGAPFEE